MSAWQPIETAPKDGTVFIARNAERPEWGSWPMLRFVRWRVDRRTGEYVLEDRAAWIKVCDHDPSFDPHDRSDGLVHVPCAIAADEWNRGVVYEWQPLPEPPDAP